MKTTRKSPDLNDPATLLRALRAERGRNHRLMCELASVIAECSRLKLALVRDSLRDELILHYQMEPLIGSGAEGRR